MTWEDPWRLAEKITKAIEKSMKETFREIPHVTYKPEEVGRSPNVDIIETPSELRVKIDAPGFKKESFSVDVTEDVVHVSAKREETIAEEQESYIRRERRFGKLDRTIKLPKKVIPESTKADYKRGVLTVYLPKKTPDKEKKTVRIEVE